MSIRKFTALAFVSVLLAGCGGGANLKFEEQLKSDLAASEAEVAKLRQDVTDALADAKEATDNATEALKAATEAQMKVTEAEKKAMAAEDDAARYRQEAEDAQAAARTAQQQATDANARADAAEGRATAAEGRATAAENQRQQLADQVEEAQQQASSLEASQRAKNLLAAFPDVTGTAPTGDSPVTIRVPSRGSLTFAQGGRSVASLSTPLLSGERGARLTRTRGGTDTTVVYTDRELSRKLLDHYASAKSSADAKQVEATSTATGFPTLAVGSDNLIEDEDWKVSHGFSSSIGASATDRAPTKERASFGGSLHGISGQFLCSGGTGACMITLTSAYNDNDPDNVTPTENRLSSVTMAVSSGATLYFKPSSASASIVLGPEGIQGRVADDSEYMTFGWWGHEPAHVNGTYTFGVFSDVEGTGLQIGGVSGVSGTAEYDGTAVGLYVEQDATTARQGEFTAEVRLTAVFGGTPSLSGEIDNFQTTPRGGSGDSTLSDSWVVVLASGGGVTIRRTGSTSSGAWSHEFVPNHGGARTDAPPPAVTGTFNTEIDNLLQIVGAYGAELQQQ